VSKTNLFLKIILAIVFVYFTLFSIKWVPKITQGFASYYTFSSLLIEGDDLSEAYNDEYFNSKVKEKGIEVSDILASNIPTNSFALAPFVWLTPKTARILWSLFSIAAFFLSIYILFNVYGVSLRKNAGLTILIIVFLWRPLYENIELGQLYGLLLLLFSLSIWGLKKNKKIGHSIALSLVFLLKGYGIVNFIWLAVKRKCKELAFTVGFVLIGILLSFLIIPPDVWKTYLFDASAKLGKLSSMGHVAYQTVNGLLMHLFIYDEKWLLHPAINLPPNTVFTASLLVNLLIIFYAVSNKIQNSKQMLLSFSAAIAAGVVTAPVAEEYHYLLFIPLLIGLSDYFYNKYSALRRMGLQEILFLLSVLLMILPLNYKALQDSVFPVYLLAYLKLYAGLILLYVFKQTIKQQILVREGNLSET
jgi:hypothetical protein